MTGKPFIDWYNVIERAAWTFVQGVAAALGIEGLTGWDDLQSVATAAAVGGAAAVVSFVKTYAQERLAAIEDGLTR